MVSVSITIGAQDTLGKTIYFKGVDLSLVPKAPCTYVVYSLKGFP